MARRKQGVAPASPIQPTGGFVINPSPNVLKYEQLPKPTPAALPQMVQPDPRPKSTGPSVFGGIRGDG